MGRKKRPSVVRNQFKDKLNQLMSSHPETSNADLARACGVARQSVASWMNGNSSVDVELIPTICDYFGISVNEFFGQDDVDLSYKEKKIIDSYRSCSLQGQDFIYDQAMLALKNFPAEESRTKSGQLPDIQVRPAATA